MVHPLRTSTPMRHSSHASPRHHAFIADTMARELDFLDNEMDIYQFDKARDINRYNRSQTRKDNILTHQLRQ